MNVAEKVTAEWRIELECKIERGMLFVEHYQQGGKAVLLQSKPTDHVMAALIQIIDRLQNRVDALEASEKS